MQWDMDCASNHSLCHFSLGTYINEMCTFGGKFLNVAGIDFFET